MSKLVRDRIPEIMLREGKAPEIEEISGDRLRAALKDKLVEEAAELRDATDVREEIADVLEVIDAIIEAYGLDRKQIESLRLGKRQDRGGFSHGCYLKTVGHGGGH